MAGLTIPTRPVRGRDRARVRVLPVGPEPLLRGEGDLTFVCCGCGMVILENVDGWDPDPPTAFACARCGTLSRVP